MYFNLNLLLSIHDSYVRTYVCICDRIRENQLGFHTHLILNFITMVRSETFTQTYIAYRNDML